MLFPRCLRPISGPLVFEVRHCTLTLSPTPAPLTACDSVVPVEHRICSEINENRSEYCIASTSIQKMEVLWRRLNLHKSANINSSQKYKVSTAPDGHAPWMQARSDRNPQHSLPPMGIWDGMALYRQSEPFLAQCFKK